MNILTQIMEDINSKAIEQLLGTRSVLCSPINFTTTSNNYVELIENLCSYIKSFARAFLINTFETMDYDYRHSEDRTKRYYVKQTRFRTIFTVFGEITYKRTEYQNKQTKQSFCYVDRKLGIKSRERYDCTVQAKLVETYAEHNSMIKAGRIVGNEIYSLFTRDPLRREFEIPRQTVYNILHRLGKVTIELPQKKETPEEIYVMADEKFIALQYHDETSSEKRKQEVRAAVIYESNQSVKSLDGQSTKRRELTNKTIVTTCDNNLWDEVLTTLSQIYDIEKIKKIYILGDGATWIKQGAKHLKLATNTTLFAVDKFHFIQAINHLAGRDEVYRELLTNYAFHNMKPEFQTVVQIIKETSLDRLETIESKQQYLINHWKAFQNLIHEVHGGCAMEQAISHVLSSHFSSVPKAYGKNNIPTYLNYRTLSQNGFCLRSLIIKARDLITNKNKNVTMKLEELDFSYFDQKQTNPTKLEKFLNKNLDYSI